MTSLESELHEEKQHGFTFTWSIHNFSHCPCEIQSPEFTVELLGSTKWNLVLRRRVGFIRCYLRRVGHTESCSFVFSLLKSNGTFEKKSEGVYMSSANTTTQLLSRVMFNELGAYLEDDTLIISCRIWKVGADLSESELFSAHTNIKVSKLNYVWNLRDIEIPITYGYKIIQTAKIQTFVSGIPIINMHVLNGGSLGVDAINFGINMPEQVQDFILDVKVHILDKDGKIVHSAHREHFCVCVNKNEIWDFPIISKMIMFPKKQIYMPGGELTLKCEFSFSSFTREPFYEVTRVAYGTTDIAESKCAKPQISTDGYGLWKENLKQFFNEGEMSDLVVRAPNKEYPVHRAILCAQSEVFWTMLKTDMKEKNTGIIEIEDLEDDTITQMLLYMYTNTIEDLDYSAAQKLYYAADRYEIKALLRVCSNQLMRILDTSNVCEILVLADTHQDKELESCAKDFILAHVQEIIYSENWENLMKTNLPFTAELMQWLLRSKFSKAK